VGTKGKREKEGGWAVRFGKKEPEKTPLGGGLAIE